MRENRPGGHSGGMRSRNTTSKTRQGVASRELVEARKRKRQKQVMRNRIIFGAVCLALLALIIFLITKVAGCSLTGKAAAETSTLTLEKDGQVVFEEVVDFDTDTYSKSELKDYINELIDSFNETYGEEAIELDKVSVSGNKAYVKTTYKDVDTYSAFTSYQTYNDVYENALEAGYDFNDTYSTVSEEGKGQGQKVDCDTVFAGKKILVVNENITVVVPGTIEYVSTDSTEVISTNTIKISPADGNEDSTELVYIVYTAD